MSFGIFAPTISSIPGLQAALDAKAPLASPTFTGTVAGITKSMVGLGSVDNTADTAKPVSTAQQTALDLKASLSGATFTGSLAVTFGSAVTVSTPLFNGSQTWNNAATAFSAFDINVTDSASAAASYLMRLGTGGVVKFSVTKAGDLTAAGNVASGGSVTPGSLSCALRTGLEIESSSAISWANTASWYDAKDLSLSRNTVGVLQITTTGGALADLLLRNILQTGYTDVAEMAAPGAPAANTARIYVDDSGGKSRLMVRFPSGAAQQISIEP